MVVPMLLLLLFVRPGGGIPQPTAAVAPIMAL